MAMTCLRKALLLAGFCLLPMIVQATPLQQAITDYEQENYEEALQALETLRASDVSAELSYYLGLTHHAMGDARQAIFHLEDAARQGQSHEQLYLALAAATMAIEDYRASLDWIDKGEAAGFGSSQLSFLKASVLARQRSYPAAMQELDRIRQPGTELALQIDYLRAQIHVAGNDFDLAAQALQKIISSAPESNLAESAREYHRQYQKQARDYRPWQGQLGLGYIYDSNAIAAPEQPVPGLPDEKDSALNARLRLEYAPRLTGNTLFSARYDINTIVYDENGTSDQIVNELSFSPGYRLQHGTFSVPVAYIHQIRDGENYEQSVSLTPTINYNLDANRVLQFGLGYTWRDILFDFVNAATEALESRAGDIFLVRIGIYCLCDGSGRMTSLRYEFSDEQTDGAHWESQGHRLALSSLIPLNDKLSFDGSIDVTRRDFDNFNTIFSKMREDTTTNAALGLTRALTDKADLYLRYQYTHADSNIFAYDYRRHLGMLGVEYGF